MPLLEWLSAKRNELISQLARGKRKKRNGLIVNFFFFFRFKLSIVFKRNRIKNKIKSQGDQFIHCLFKLLYQLYDTGLKKKEIRSSNGLLLQMHGNEAETIFYPSSLNSLPSPRSFPELGCIAWLPMLDVGVQEPVGLIHQRGMFSSFEIITRK